MELLNKSRSDRLEFEIVLDRSWRHLVDATIVEAIQRGALRPGDRLARMWGVSDLCPREEAIVPSPSRGKTTVLSRDHDGTREET